MGEVLLLGSELCEAGVGHLGELVGLSGLELSGGDAVLEQDLEFAERPVLGLGEAEPAPDIAQQVGARVEESSLGAPAPSYRSSAKCAPMRIVDTYRRRQSFAV